MVPQERITKPASLEFSGVIIITTLFLKGTAATALAPSNENLGIKLLKLYYDYGIDLNSEAWIKLKDRPISGMFFVAM